MKRLLVVCCWLTTIQLFAQDKIILRSGDTLNVIIAEADDQRVSYVSHDDPELNTMSITTDQIRKIQWSNGKVIDYRKKRYPRYYVGIYFGDAIPFSDFAQDNPYDDRSGFARDKPFFSIEGRMPIFRFIGAQADISVGSFGVNSAPYLSYLNNKYNSSLIFINGYMSHYRYGTFSIGPDLGFNLGKRIKAFIPVQLSFISIDNKGNDHFNFEDKNTGTLRVMERKFQGAGIGFSLGAKLDVMLGKRIGVGLSAKLHDYLVNMKVQEMYLHDNTTVDYQWVQSVSYFYLGINVHYHFK